MLQQAVRDTFFRFFADSNVSHYNRNDYAKGVYEISVHPRRERPCPLLRSLTTATEV